MGLVNSRTYFILSSQRKRLNLPQLQSDARLKMDIQAAKTVAITVLAFLACYIPPILIAVWGRLRSDESWWYQFLAQFSPLISSGINPAIYCFRTRRFRSALKQLLKDPCGRTPFQETNKVQMVQRDILRETPRQAAANNRIIKKHEKASLAPGAHVTVDQRSCLTTVNCCSGGTWTLDTTL